VPAPKVEPITLLRYGRSHAGRGARTRSAGDRRLALLVTVVGLQAASASAGGIGIGTDGGVNPLLPPTRFGVSLLQTPALPRPASRTLSPAAYVLPALASAIVPGAGEIITGHFWRGIPFVLADVATWIRLRALSRTRARIGAPVRDLRRSALALFGRCERQRHDRLSARRPAGRTIFPCYYDGQYGARLRFLGYDPALQSARVLTSQGRRPAALLREHRQVPVLLSGVGRLGVERRSGDQRFAEPPLRIHAHAESRATTTSTRVRT
jgi:hypothetical protein